jgi:hypothetical protein
VVKVIVDDSQADPLYKVYSWRKLASIGLLLGIGYWVLSILLTYYVIDPLFCGSQANVSSCANSTLLAGDIATIIIAFIGIGILVRSAVARPIVVAIASLTALWGLSGLTEGLFWLEAVAWSAFLYGLTYVLFSWISRYALPFVVIVTTVIVITLIRIITVL